MTAYVLCGIPGSGKTTLSYQLAEQNNAVVHSIDDIPNAWGNHDIDGKIHNQWVENIKADLQMGNSVVCDGVSLNSNTRKWILRKLSEFDCEKVLIVKAVPVEVCIQRNKGRFREVPENLIRTAAKMLEPPTKEEGWDKIYMYSE